MKKTAFLFFLLSLFTIPPLWGQKSFSFRLNFTLTDKEGTKITPEDFWSGKVRLQASGFHRKKFVYNDETGYFRYSESSLHPYAQLNFITDADTTIIVLSEMTFHIEDIPLSGDWYIFSSYFDRKGNDIAYDYEINAYTLRQPLRLCFIIPRRKRRVVFPY
ncbi:hypothetical protein [Dysgonomonas sp. 25]|uniref:hypothetical protein n=1 Tax=Dysgonomonas sp. 25 TaxID=2302933 RepID=UPI0013D60D17|nr:hypothetical protein [Dysgonomonas sp. 25]NDV69196.1 hypothetical protein [Dysgonomonas sp. 25]